MNLVTYAAAAADPVTLAEAKANIFVASDFATDDALITSMIAAATKQAEAFTGRALVQRTYDLYLDAFPACGVIGLPYPPLVSVTSIVYEDTSSVSTTLAASSYQVSTSGVLGRVALEPTGYWPTTEYARLDAVRVRYVAGYGAAGASDSGVSAVPADFKHAIKMLVADLYKHRESFVTGTIVNVLPVAAERLLSPYRVPNVLLAA